MGLSRRHLLATLALATAIAPLTGALPAAAAAPGSAPVAVVVRGTSSDAAAEAVQAAGGSVGKHLGLVDGVAATVPGRAVASLQAQGLAVVADAPAHVVDNTFSVTGRDVQVDAVNPGPGWGADAGAGVGVALVDTGVIDTPDLAGRVLRGPDFSGEGDGIDRYGHGTFMAGLIAGNGATHKGVAPAARIISVKVAGADGSTTLSNVIAGIGWVVVHQDEVGISVLNLSLGVEAPMPYEIDPLAAAVEAAWSSGLTVVVAAGNAGAGRVTSPGIDPYVITVGATDPHGTAATSDDTVAPWSGSDDFLHYDKPEILAPGTSVISLRAPGATIDREFPAARIADRYFRGSGTSMATALTSGAAAVLLQHHPLATPDDVKGAMVDGGRSIGHKTTGLLLDLARAGDTKGSPSWDQHFPVAFDGLDGRLKRMPWQGTRWSGTRWSGSTWSGSTWSGSTWSGTRWSGSTWSGSTWSGSTWSGTRWSDADWSGTRWSGSTWSGSTWSGSTWSDGDWAGSRWSGSRWSGSSWSGSTWSGSRWSGASWGDAVPTS
jgi:serine protease AprX